MKTVFKTGTPEWANRKRRKFESATGVKWEWYRTGQGFVFTPIVTRETPEDGAAAAVVEAVLSEARSFVKVAELTGLPLKRVLAGAKWLVRNGNACPIVNRCGHFAGIRPRR